MSAVGGGPLEAPELLYELGRQVQAVALAMRAHEIVTGLGVCKSCGRIPECELPGFGLRCSVVVDKWGVVQRLLPAVLRGNDHRHGRYHADPPSAVGRASVPPPKP